jgi:hypothetical protein
MQSEFKSYLQSNANSLPAAPTRSKIASANGTNSKRAISTKPPVLPKAKQQHSKPQPKLQQKQQTQVLDVGTPDPGTSILEWLGSVNPALEKYAKALAECGFEDVSLLVEAEESDLEEAFDEAGVKKFHIKLILKAFAKLKQ